MLFDLLNTERRLGLRLHRTANFFPYDRLSGNSTYVNLAKVLEAHVMSDAGDPLTHISGGFIRLKERIMRCWFEREKNGFMYVELRGQTSTGNRKLKGGNHQPRHSRPRQRGSGRSLVFSSYALRRAWTITRGQFYRMPPPPASWAERVLYAFWCVHFTLE